MSNPLLEEHPLPPFARITVDHVEPAVNQRIDQIFSVLETQLSLIENGAVPTWDNLVAPFEEASDLLNQTWSPISHLNGVKNSDALRKVYEACIQKLTELGTAIDQHEPLYRAYKRLAGSESFQQLSVPQQAVIEHALRDFRLAGVALSEKEKRRYAEIQQKLSALSNQFSNNVLDSTQAWYCQFDDVKALAGLPESAVALAQQTAQQKQLSGYVITLDMPSYLAVITYADDRKLREKIYRAFATRASTESDLADKDIWDNTKIIEDILSCRHELACLLGFDNYAQLSLSTKMAETPEQVIDFLENLAEKSTVSAKKDWQELCDYVRDHASIDVLEAWDIAYYSEQLKQEQYAISQEVLRPYFPAEKVKQGLFEVVKRLFGIQVISDDSAELYHPDVHFYRIEKNQQTIAYFYFDIYARDKKRGGAWMADCRSRRLRKVGDTIKLQHPVAYLTCNFTPPVGDSPSLLTHQEVTTLFHEFGHGLHHMLTEIEVAPVSGISGVAWDAVELPSQFLENWCWQPLVIPMISGHHKTGEPLPDDLLNKMLAAKNFQSGLQMLRQVEFSLFDMLLHKEYDVSQQCDVQEVLNRVREKISIVFPPTFNRFQNSFSHIFAGGYAAGYYSYKWAEVLSADAFSLFEEKGIFDKATGELFLHTVLANGGSKPAMELFVDFRGREPKIDALLKHSGL